MYLTDEQLQLLITAGYNDEQIMRFAHENTKPSDLYGAVAEVVMQALHGDPVLIQLLDQAEPDSALGKFNKSLEQLKEGMEQEVANWWKELGVGRSDTKKIVMTYLYGSTEYGNRDSINERIEERAEEILEDQLDPYFDRSGADVFKSQRTLAVTVMVRLTRGAMAVVCPSTVVTMDTIQDWAFSLGAMDIPFKFKTHLNFMVYQSNPNTHMKEIPVWENNRLVMRLYYREPVNDGKRLNERKMKAGSAPNFVHAHDACHLQMATLGCDSEYFHHIHDSMGTQCADTPALAEAIRQAFCDMYADADVLFSTYVLNKGHEIGLTAPEELGELEVNEATKSRYFFS